MNQSKPNSIGTEVKPNANESAKCKFRNIFIKKHFTKIKYLTKNLLPYHCTSI